MKKIVIVITAVIAMSVPAFYGYNQYLRSRVCDSVQECIEKGAKTCQANSECLPSEGECMNEPDNLSKNGICTGTAPITGCWKNVSENVSYIDQGIPYTADGNRVGMACL